MPDTVLKIHDILVVLLSWASQTLLALYWALVRCAIASTEQSLLLLGNSNSCGGGCVPSGIIICQLPFVPISDEYGSL
jgi:hypothetical protein